MQNQAALAYQQTAKKTASPREMEANLLARAAARLNRIRKDWDTQRGDLREALTFNRKIWSIFLNSATQEDSPLPKDIRQNIANLGLFVMNQTMEVMANPTPEKLDTLININKEVAAGLRS